MNILMIGAHPDDCDLRCSGLAKKYADDGHRVRFLSMCDGSGGHHVLGRNEIAARRLGETREAAAVIGIEYDVWNIPDCEITADLYTRARLVNYIRSFKPDIIFCHRTNDYHADHRNSALLVQDASYLLIVPNYCPETEALREMPVIMYFYDRFKVPPFEPDVVIDTDDVVLYKYAMIDKHVSQVYEWLPYTNFEPDKVPAEPAARLEWLKGGVTPATTDAELKQHSHYGYRFAEPAMLYRDKLIERYGEQRGSKIRFAEAYQLSEYGTQLTPESMKKLFPY